MLLRAQTEQSRKPGACRDASLIARNLDKSASRLATSQPLHSLFPQEQLASAGDTLALLPAQAEETAGHWTKLVVRLEVVLRAAVPSEALFVWPRALPSLIYFPAGVFRSGLGYLVLCSRLYLKLQTTNDSGQHHLELVASPKRISTPNTSAD